jgi:ABC-type Zn2+ transport system substrate-binding protein/surface adhesin
VISSSFAREDAEGKMGEFTNRAATVGESDAELEEEEEQEDEEEDKAEEEEANDKEDDDIADEEDHASLCPAKIFPGCPNQLTYPRHRSIS